MNQNRQTGDEVKIDSYTGRLLAQRYKVGEKLWEDELWVVYEGLDIIDETAVHVRLYSKYANLDPLSKEVLISQQVSHPTIPDFKSWNLDKSSSNQGTYSVTEPVHLKPLCNGQQYSERMIRFLFEQVLDSVESLQQASFYGLSLDQNSFAINKLSTFDEGMHWLKFIGQEKLRTKNPESTDERRKIEYEDISALGALLFMLITGWMPFGSKEPTDYFYNLLTSDIEKFIENHKVFDQILKSNRISTDLIDLVIILLQWTEEDYPSIPSIRSSVWMETTEKPHPWFLKPIIDIL